MFDVVIIGNGATAVAVLRSLFVLAKEQQHRLNIAVVGKVSNLGFGLAYNEDNDSALMNTPTSNISIDSEDGDGFLKWAASKGQYFDRCENIPRRIYGQYLHQVATELAAQPNVTFFDTYASDIKLVDGCYKVTTANHNKNISCRRVVLCIGVSRMNDFYQLSSLDGYVFNPYPLNFQLSHIDKSKSVLVLGSGLTAVDICVYLETHQHQGTVILCSRHGRLPTVKSVVKPYQPKWCRFEQFMQIAAAQSGPLSLRQLLRRVRRELREVASDWREIFFPRQADDANRFLARMEQAQTNLPWLDVLVGIQHEIDLTWAYVEEGDKARFIKDYLPDVLRAIAPMPLVNARILARMFMAGKLKIVAGVNAITPDGEQFLVHLTDQPTLAVSHIVNATGFDRHLSQQDAGFLGNLLKRKLVYAHPSGGIQVNPICGRAAPENNGIYAVGHLTAGEHPLINNIEFIVMNAKTTATAIIKDLEQELI